MIVRVNPKYKDVYSGSIYIDYENIYQWLLIHYNIDLLNLNFFPAIKTKLQTYNINILNVFAYGDYEYSIPTRHKFYLQQTGIQIVPSGIMGKNSSKSYLICDVMDALNNKKTEVYVIISTDQDIIPLLEKIRKRIHKISFVITIKKSINAISDNYADFIIYIEDIFDLKNQNNLRYNIDNNPEDLTPLQIARAKQVSRYLYSSQIWKKSRNHNGSIKLDGYLKILEKTVDRSPKELEFDFQVAHYLQYVNLCYDTQSNLILEEGKKKTECMQAP